MNFFRKVFSGKKAPVEEENGKNGEHNGEESSEEEEITISYYAKLSDDKLSSLCKKHSHSTGSKYEMIGRLLDQIQSNLNMDQLILFENDQLIEMCKGRDISISNGSSKEQIAILLHNHVNGKGEEESDDIDVLITTSKNRRLSAPIEMKKKKSGMFSRFLGKRGRAESSMNMSAKKRRLSIGSNDFLRIAEPIKLKIDDSYYDIEPRLYKGTGAIGWCHMGRQEFIVGGENLDVAWALNMTVIGEKEDVEEN